ncbi:hypothetical protein [Prochlorococcus sp. MIT 1223]|uniref:hypothetical protein n=1 Tax=Prochlorococcus sp. MIT 1223 TaxID=3096217 RepID=UPI002A75B9D2|nr:hypothetical protein [Prochlorococcus sp. MIT 1223]
MTKRNSFLKKIYKINKHGYITGSSLILIAICLIPGAIKSASEVFCIGQSSNKIWLLENNHSEANMIAVQRCNGRN